MNAEIRLSKETHLSVVDNLIYWCFIGFLATFAFEGIVRFGLSKLGVPSLLYLRDLIEVLSICVVFFRALYVRRYIEPAISIVTSILVLHLLISLLFGASVFQVLFGLKIFMPVVYGISVWPIIEKRFKHFMWVLAIFFVFSISGVYINKIIGHMPWEGQFYDTAFGRVQGTRLWWTDGTSRLSGLSRASYDAAMVIGITALSCFTLTNRWFFRLIISTLALAAIFLTTSKGMVLAFLIITCLTLLIVEKYRLKMAKFSTLCLSLLSIILPSFIVYFSFSSGVVSREIPHFLTSIWERFTWMWPGAFDLLKGWYAYIIGNGLGAVGIPLQYSGSYVVGNSADNIFIYFFINFGGLGLFYLLLIILRAIKIQGYLIYSAWAINVLLITFGYGLTTNMIESAFFSAIFGIVVGVLLTDIDSTAKLHKLHVNKVEPHA